MYVREDLYICTCICVSYSLIVFTACGASKHFLCAYSICVCGVFILLPLEGGFDVHIIYILTRFGLSIKNQWYIFLS